MVRPIRFLLDNNAPDSVRRFIEAETAHSIILVREHLMEDATDAQIASTAVTDDLIIITHDRDFRRYLPQVSGHAGGVVRIRTSEPHAQQRIASALEIIEFHILDCHSRGTRPRLDLGMDYVVVHDIDPKEYSEVDAALRFHFDRSRRADYDFVAEISPRFWKFTERRRRKRSAPAF